MLNLNFRDWLTSISNGQVGTVMSYPSSCNWWIAVLRLIPYLDNQVAVVTKDINGSGLNTGFGIGNKDQVPDLNLRLTKYTISPEEAYSCQAKYLIYSGIGDVPNQLPLKSDRKIIVMATWGLTVKELTRLLNLGLVMSRLDLDDLCHHRINYLTINSMLTTPHSSNYLALTNNSATGMIPNFDYPVDTIKIILKDWSRRVDANNRVPLLQDWSPFFQDHQLSQRSPKLYEIYNGIKHSPQDKHVIITSYAGNYGAAMISQVLAYFGINTQVAGFRNKNQGIEILESFSQESGGAVLVTNFSPISEITGVSTIHIIDTFDFNILKGWIKYSTNKDLKVRLYISNLSADRVNLTTVDLESAISMSSNIKEADAVIKLFEEVQVRVYLDDDLMVATEEIPSRYSPPVNSNATIDLVRHHST